MRAQLAPLALLACLACGAPRLTLDVSVDTGGAPAQSLVVTLVTEDGGAVERLVNTRLDQFLLHLPADTRGRLQVSLVALDASGCLVATGPDRVLELASEERRALRFALSPLSQPACGVVVERVGGGEGQVTSEPPGLLCPPDLAQPCAGSFPAGTRVTLRAEAAAGASIFSGWSGACQGTSCEIIAQRRPSLVQAGFLSKRVCTPSYCWEAPLPQGNTLSGLAVGVGAMWTVGGAGQVLRRVGDSWAAVQTDTLEQLSDIWVEPDPLWRERTTIVGARGTILQGQGMSLRRVDSGTDALLFRIHSAGPGDLWIVGDRGTILRSSGEAFVPVPSPTRVQLTGISGAAPDDLWAVGAQGTVLRWRGQAWTPGERPPGATEATLLLAVWAAGRDDVWLIGEDGDASTLWRYRGGRYEIVLRLEGRDHPGLGDVWGSGPNDVWVVGADVYHDDGSGLRRIRRSNNLASLFRVRGSSPWDVWFVGIGGVTARWNGVSWDSLSEEVPLVVGLGEGKDRRTYGVGILGQILTRTAAGTWEVEASHRFMVLAAALAGGPDDSWGVGEGGILWGRLPLDLMDGSPRTWVTIETGAPGFLRAIARGAGTEVIVAGDGGWLMRCETALDRLRAAGASCPRIDSGVASTLYAVARAGDEIWAAGDGGVVLRCKADRCTRVPSGTSARLYALWLTDPRDVWVAGEGDVVLRGGAGGFSAVTGAVGIVRTLFGGGSDDLWLAGSYGIDHFDGQELRRLREAPLTYFLTGFHSTAGDWVGGQGILQLTRPAGR